MEQLIELLKQIQDLAGAGIDALSDLTSGGREAPAPGPEGAAGGPPPEAPPAS